MAFKLVRVGSDETTGLAYVDESATLESVFYCATCFGKGDGTVPMQPSGSEYLKCLNCGGHHSEDACGRGQASSPQITHATHGSPAQTIQVRRSEWLVNGLDNTGRFEHTRQASGYHTFMLYGYPGATIKVLPSGRWAHIRVGALEKRVIRGGGLGPCSLHLPESFCVNPSARF